MTIQHQGPAFEATSLEGFGGSIERTEAPDGAIMQYRRWSAARPTDAAIYLHGIAGHSLWFGEAATRLAASGVTVYGLDRRGAGINRGFRPGHLAHHRVLLRDIAHFVRLARREHPSGQVFLIAGCWGAKAGAFYAADGDEPIDRLVLVSPALSVRIGLPTRDLLGVMSALLTNERRSYSIPLQPEDYTENPSYRELVAKDPLRLLTVTARFYLETARLDRHARLAAPRIRVPTLLLQGDRDAIVNVPRVAQWFEHVGALDKTMRLYPSFAHILEFEEQREAYFSDLLGWFQNHGTGADSAPRPTFV
jgi:alpha-beta hydrolase superfamily lysophospholipase